MLPWHGLLLALPNLIVFTDAAAVGCSAVDESDVGEVVESINMQVVCGGDSIIVKISSCILEEMGYNVTEDISIAGIDDNPRENGKICSLIEEKQGEYFYMTLSNFSDCRTDAYSSENTAWYYNAVRTVHFSNTKNKSVRRSRSVYLPFACKYKTVYDSFTDGYRVISGQVVTIASSPQVGENDLSVNLCFDQFCSNGSIQVNDEIGTGDVLYLVAQSTSIHPIEIAELWATRDSDPGEESHRHILAEDGCPTELSTTVVSMQPFNAFVLFVMFNWIPDVESDVYIHADISLCNFEQETCIQPQCEELPIQKRDVRTAKTVRGTVTVGPFHYKSSRAPKIHSSISLGV